MMYKFLLTFIFTFSFILLNAQTTVNYSHRSSNYVAFANSGGNFNTGGGNDEVGMYANGGGAKQSVIWRRFKTAGDGTGSDKSMNIGDEFRITIACRRAYGQIGVALLANPSMNNWNDRISNYVAQVNLNGNSGSWGNWQAVYNAGANSNFAFGGDQSNYNDFVITFKIQSSNRMTISINGEFKRDVPFNGTSLPTHYSVYLADDWSGAANSDIYVKPGYLKSTGFVELGYFLTSGNLDFTGVSDGIKANSTATTEVNNVTIGGNLSTFVSMSTANTFTGNLTVNENATLKVEHNDAVKTMANLTINGTVELNGTNVVRTATVGTLTMGATGKLIIKGTATLPENYTTHNLNTTSSVEYAGSNQVIAALNSADYGYVIASGTGAKSFSGSVSIAKDLTINTGSDLTVATDQILTVKEKLLVSGGTVTLNHNGNLIQNGTSNANSGNITVNRNSQNLMRLDYTLWSSPVAVQNLADFSPLTISNRFYTYSTSSDIYSAIANTNDFTVGKGYLIRTPDNHPTTATTWSGTFVGAPNNGDISTAISDAGNGYNAIGNPYPSPISIASFLADNSSNIEGTLYFWRKTNGASGSAYVSYSGGSFSDGSHTYNNIQSAQGFLVQAKTGATSVNFKNTQRAVNNGVFYRTSQEEGEGRIWLNLTQEEDIVGQFMVGYKANASNDFDDTDGLYLNDSSLAMASLVNEAVLSVQHRALPFESTDIVPLQFKTDTAGSFTIEINELDGLFSTNEQDVFLKDNLLNLVHNLNDAAYSFVSEAGIFSNRFEIVYQNSLGVADLMQSINVIVYGDKEQIQIKTLVSEINSVHIFDILGRKVVEVLNQNKNLVVIPATQLANQTYVVQVKLVSGEVITKKIMR